MEQLAGITTELGGDGEKQSDSFHRGQLFEAAAGMNPSLPWDDWYDNLVLHDFNNAAGEQMTNEEHHALLLTSFEARVLAETDTECNEQWTVMKEAREWSGRGGMQYPK
eukprot:1559769-Rhodomonas_salina.1